MSSSYLPLGLANNHSLLLLAKKTIIQFLYSDKVSFQDSYQFRCLNFTSVDQLLRTDLHCISEVTQADGVGEVIGTAGGETTVGHIVDGQLTTSAAASVV